jgi:peptidoglycan-associated lipoprotein
MKRKFTTLTAVALFLVGTLTLAAGCKKKPPTTVPDERPPAESPETTPETRVPPPTTPQTGRDVEGADLTGSLDEVNRRGYLTDAFFDYDQADLRDDARTALAADAEWLKRNGAIQVLIEGHADERGTSEYNLALADRRANAARDYVVSLGVDGSRIRTVSYGKERPVCDASTEECWQQNRRAHFVITAK